MTTPPSARSWRVFASFQGYRRAWVRTDVIAGSTVWAVLVPEALAYATIAGVPPVIGLYAAIPSLVLYAVAGSTRHLVVGPRSATAALSAASVAPFAGGDSALFLALTVALAIVTGVLGLLAGLLRLGFIASFISEPVLKGFIVGLALTILIGQLPKFFGEPKSDGNFFQQTRGVIAHLGDTPVQIVGEIEAGLPDFGAPNVGGLSGYLDLAGPAAGVVIVGFAEGLGGAKTYAARAGYKISANGNSSVWAPPISGPACVPEWWSTAVCRRPR